MLKYGLRAVLSPSSPVYVPPSANPDFLKFVTGFTRNSTMKAWKKAMGSLVPVNDLSLQSFDLLRDGGVAAETYEAKSFTAAYRTADERQTLLEEIEHIHASGGDITFDVLTGDEARSIEPALSDNIGAAIVLHGQRFINPGAYVSALADSVIDRGGKILTGAAITRISEAPDGVLVTSDFGVSEHYDAVVVATGAWLGQMAREFGVKRVVQAGRGYSFSVAVDDLPNGPVYFPAARVACTPVGDRLRVAGMMEFRKPEAALDHRRIQAIVEAARPLLKGADLDHRQDEWVGSRPCTVRRAAAHRRDERAPRSSSPAATACGASRSAPSPVACSPSRSSPASPRPSWRPSTRCAERPRTTQKCPPDRHGRVGTVVRPGLGSGTRRGPTAYAVSRATAARPLSGVEVTCSGSEHHAIRMGAVPNATSKRSHQMTTEVRRERSTPSGMA